MDSLCRMHEADCAATAKSFVFAQRRKGECALYRGKGDFFAKKSPSFPRQSSGLFGKFISEKSDG